MVDKANKNPFSTKKWRRIKETPSNLANLLSESGDYSVYNGCVDGETSFFFVGKFGQNLYVYPINRGHLGQVEYTQERIERLNCRFRPNYSINPFERWKKSAINQSIPNYEAKLIRDGKDGYFIGRYNDTCYTIKANDSSVGCEVDWVKSLGVFVHL